MDSPCFNCDKKKVTKDYDCHQHCKEYKHWKGVVKYNNKVISEMRSMEKALDRLSHRFEE